ncbi:trans-sulfuration enzyme family protein [Cohnella phaseoli]|uniref:homocysteine desulfhydrase n=1 Tax=Cohnella phaseoli TaxID=456490 RepID=A0A3D9JRZ1_9BACL|nr:aminotransferase class I/II-fold pyridoxal phosphate-dependent enzyme [Cohnella phaseoli]RED76873.1 cystathionine gamma-lyase [Cohnella phaseoli]
MSVHPGQETWSKEDICAHLGDDYDRFLGAIVPPIFQNSLFTRKTVNHGYTYTRVTNPTTEIAETKIAALEEGEEAKCFASGMAAITSTLMSVLEQGSHVLCPRSVYTPTRAFLENYMPRFGVEATFVESESVEAFERAIRPNTKVILLESPVSNLFTLQDLAQLAGLARAHNLTTIIDNTWATPMYQNPIRLGIDLVVHSASKYMGGHSDIVGGVVVGRKETLTEIMHRERGLFGAIMDPHQSWLLLRGLRTLPLRMRQHQESGMKVAKFLEEHPAVERVFYPGLQSHPQFELGRKQMSGYSGLMSFVPKGSVEQIRAFIKQLSFFEEGPSWGGFESLINSPGVGISEEASSLTGIPSGLVRISVGLEKAETLIDDLDRGLFAMKA